MGIESEISPIVFEVTRVERFLNRYAFVGTVGEARSCQLPVYAAAVELRFRVDPAIIGRATLGRQSFCTRGRLYRDWKIRRINAVIGNLYDA